MEEREKYMKKQVDQLKRDITSLKEKSKLLEKRLDYTQDEVTKLAVEKQALVMSVKLVYDIALRVAEKENIHKDMGLPPPPPSGTPATPPKSEGPENLYG